MGFKTTVAAGALLALPAVSASALAYDLSLRSYPTCSADELIADPSICDGRQCSLQFSPEANIVWQPVPNGPALKRLEFPGVLAAYGAPAKPNTVCDTAAFKKFYSTSLASASNRLNDNCEIVFDVDLPGGRKTAITQGGESGAYINFGTVATANYVAGCNNGQSQCVTATTATLATAVAYTGDLKSTVEGYARETRYALPQVASYFPKGDPLGQCSNVEFLTPSAPAYGIYPRQQTTAPPPGTAPTPAPGGPTVSCCSEGSTLPIVGTIIEVLCTIVVDGGLPFPLITTLCTPEGTTTPLPVEPGTTTTDLPPVTTTAAPPATTDVPPTTTANVPPPATSQPPPATTSDVVPPPGTTSNVVPPPPGTTTAAPAPPGTTSSAPAPGVPAPGVPAPGVPAPGVPAPGVPSPGAPSGGVPAPGAPSGGSPSGGSPSTGSPSGGSPSGGSPSGGSPSGGSPSGGAPSSGSPSGGAPAGSGSGAPGGSPAGSPPGSSGGTAGSSTGSGSASGSGSGSSSGSPGSGSTSGGSNGSGSSSAGSPGGRPSGQQTNAAILNQPGSVASLAMLLVNILRLV